MAYLDEESIRTILNKAAKRAGSMMALAQEFGMNDQFLGRVARGRDPVSETIAEKLGYRRLVVFEAIGKETK